MASNSSSNSLSLSLKTRLQLGILSVVADLARRSDITVNRRLYNFLDRKLPADPVPRNSVSTHDVTVDAARDLWFRLFVPAATPAKASIPVIIFFHGGGFAFLGAGSFAYDAVGRRFARRLNAVVVSINYRLSPEHKFPAQYDDAFDVIRFLNDPINRRSIASWPENADITKCFLAGDSAGGNIAHHTAVRYTEEPLSNLRIIGSVVIQPFFGGEERTESEIRLEGAPVVTLARTEWMWKAFYPDELGPDHWASNVSGPKAKDISGLDLPATMVVVGGFDPLQDWQRRYFWWLQKSGKNVKLVEYPNVCHAFYVFPDVAESSALIHEIKDFMSKHLSSL
ncbi:hypothetical protein V2J09_007782 [Rumex salicifolius]